MMFSNARSLAVHESATRNLFTSCTSIVLLLLATSLGQNSSASATERQKQSVNVTQFVERQTDRIIIKYKEHSSPVSTIAGAAKLIDTHRSSFLKGTEARYGVQLKQFRQMYSGAHVFQLSKPMRHSELYEMAAQLKASDPNIEHAEPDRIVQLRGVPNDARYSEMWNLQESLGGIRAPHAWSIATGTGITVAVLDSGYRPHVDLVGNIVGGYDMVASKLVAQDGDGRDPDATDPGDWNPDQYVGGACITPAPAMDSSWHGTHVGGIIAAKGNNSIGTVGVAYNAKIVPVRVLGRCGGGYDSDLIDAIAWATGGNVSGIPANSNVARVVNMSLGGYGRCPNMIQSVIDEARGRGAVIVAAADDETSADANGNSYPANCAGVISVASMDRTGARSNYSKFGAPVTLSAPGDDILSTWNTGKTKPGSDSYDLMTGTSMSTPHVSGVVALMLSKNPNLTPDQVKNKLEATARAYSVTCSVLCGAGIVDAYFAVLSAAGIDKMPTLITSARTIGATLSSTTDADWYMVDLPVGKTLHATLLPNTTSDYNLAIYDSSLTKIGESKLGVGQADLVSATNGGTLTVRRYIKVTFYSGGTGAVYGKYSLKLQF